VGKTKEKPLEIVQLVIYLIFRTISAFCPTAKEVGPVVARTSAR